MSGGGYSISEVKYMDQTVWKEKNEITVNLTANHYLKRVNFDWRSIYPGGSQKIPANNTTAKVEFYHELNFLDPGVTLAIRINGEFIYKETGMYRDQLLENPIKLSYRINDNVESINIEWIYGY